MAGRTGACAQAGDLPTGPDQTRVHTEGQRQAQAAGHLNRAGSGLHDGSDPRGLHRGRPPIGTLRLPSRAQRPQAVVEVEELLFRGHPEVVDADLADYFGSIPHAELLKSVAHYYRCLTLLVRPYFPDSPDREPKRRRRPPPPSCWLRFFTSRTAHAPI